MGLGQYNSLGEYCDPHTASSVFLILIFKNANWPRECKGTSKKSNTQVASTHFISL